MGKFERGEAESLELGLVDLLNNRSRSRYHHNCLYSVFRKIKADIPGISKAQFIGRNYNEPGDIKVLTRDNKIIYIELKLVESGKGTRANISQDTPTELDLLSDPKGYTLSWSRYRAKNNFDDHVKDELNKFKKYPPHILTKEERAMYLKDKYIRPDPGGSIERKAKEILQSSKDPDKRSAAQIVLNILELARQDKLGYIQYLKGLNQNSDKIKKFTLLLLLGFHKTSVLKEAINRFNYIINSLRSGNFNYRTYYVIKRDCKVFVEDLSCWIPKFINFNFKILFPQDETCVIIAYSEQGGTTYLPILRIVFHWKNIFQGIKTPCLNVFDEGILKNYLTCSDL